MTGNPERRPGVETEETQLASAEASILDAVGFAEGRTGAPDALKRLRIALNRLVLDSFTIEDVARALGVSTGWIRRRLSQNRTLYGVKGRHGWRIPRFQFSSACTLVRGIAGVIPHVRHDAHPVAVKIWFTTPDQDLVVGDDDERVTPRAWLSSGRSVEIAAELANEI